MPGTHAFLAPSAAHRWLVCTAAPHFEKQFPETVSAYADEGTAAHELGELRIAEFFQQIPLKEAQKTESEIKASQYYSEEMEDYCIEYRDFVVEKFFEIQRQCKDAAIYLERKLDLTQWVKEGFGRGDCGIVADATLTTFDLKYGKGVPVGAEDNKQCKIYALGWLNSFAHLYNIKKVVCWIFQPRIDNVSSMEISVEELLAWGQDYVKPRAELAFNGPGEFVPGEHCTFCKGKTRCKALADYHMSLAAFEFAEPNYLADDSLAEILAQRDSFIKWIDAVAEYALEEAIKGHKWSGFKLVHGRSNRRFSDPENAIKVLEKNLYTADEYLNMKLKGLGDLEKLLGKNDFLRLLNPYIVKPEGKPTLVTVKDKRSEINSLEQAEKDFADPFPDPSENPLQQEF